MKNLILFVVLMGIGIILLLLNMYFDTRELLLNLAQRELSGVVLATICILFSRCFYLKAKKHNEQTATVIKTYCNRILSFLDCMNKKEKGVSIIPSKLGEVPSICKELSGHISVKTKLKGNAEVIHKNIKD